MLQRAPVPVTVAHLSLSDEAQYARVGLAHSAPISLGATRARKHPLLCKHRHRHSKRLPWTLPLPRRNAPASRRDICRDLCRGRSPTESVVYSVILFSACLPLQNGAKRGLLKDSFYAPKPPCGTAAKSTHAEITVCLLFNFAWLQQITVFIPLNHGSHHVHV
jgi:hypothetical protein